MTPTEEELLDELFDLHVLESEKHRVFEESLMNTEDFETLFWPWNFDFSSPGQRKPELKRIFSFIPPVNCHVWKEQGRMSMKDDDQQILTLEPKLMNQQMTKLKRMTSEEDGVEDDDMACMLQILEHLSMMELVTGMSEMMRYMAVFMKQIPLEKETEMMGTQDRFNMSDLIMEDKTLNNFFTLTAETM